MFATTPRWRERLDARKVALVAVIAMLVFALQIALLAGTVARPLGAMIADLDRIPQLDAGPSRPAYIARSVPAPCPVYP